MATEIDATTSIYKMFQDFTNILNTDDSFPEFTFISTTSLESAYAALNLDDSKIVVVQTECKEVNNKFTQIEYAVVPSFSGEVADNNSILMHRVNSKFTELYKQYTAIQVYDAEGLMSNPSVLTPLTTKLVVTKLEQGILGAEQLQNNFNSLKITFLGYLG